MGVRQILDGWHHVVVGWTDRGEVLFAVDGRFPEGSVVYESMDHRSGAQPFRLAESPSPDEAATTLLGRIRHPWWNEGRTSFTGRIDELMVWDRALTREEIVRMWEAVERGESGADWLGR